MTTADATLDIGLLDAVTGALSGVAELERLVRKPAAIRRVSMVLKLVQSLARFHLALFFRRVYFLMFLNVLDVGLLLIVGMGHRKTRRLTSYMNQAAFDGDEGLAELKRIASRCGDLVQRLDSFYGQRRRLGRLWGRLLPLNGLVLPQLDTLIGEVEDIGETAALSASPEFTDSIMQQLAAHGVISSDEISSDDL